MKAISLWQPWASAVALGSKTIETRHWSTSYRGPLAIHAAKRLNRGEMIFYGSCWNWVGALSGLGAGSGNHFDLIGALPLGAIVAVCNLTDCRPTESFTQGELDVMRAPDRESGHLYQWCERQMGNFDLGRFGWILEDIRALPDPIPFVGRRGLFNVPDSVFEEPTSTGTGF
jgi:hypothetical protein